MRKQQLPGSSCGSRDKQICLSECFLKGKKKFSKENFALETKNSPVSHNVQKDWELLVGDGNVKKNRNTENVNEQAETGGTTGCWYRERERDKNL
ncbi:hypothetical protein EK904_015172 [Melospiza melodia maxima]|nr:hypothetical protein EK904_015172 [Melospiza melodia maxima]